MKIIRDRAIVDDDFVLVTDGTEHPTETKLLVPLAAYLQTRETLLARHAAVGVRVPSDKLPSDIPDLERLAAIAIEFPRFTDGRGYSVARMLRQRHGYRGELRAVGWVLRDQLLYLERCGFNAFELKPGKSLESGLEAFTELTVTYQAAADDPRPLYRRR